MMQKFSFTAVVGACVLAATLPGCLDWSNKKSDDGSSNQQQVKKEAEASTTQHAAKKNLDKDTLLTVNGESELTAQEFEEFLHELQKDPNWNLALQMNPEGEKEIFKQLKATALCKTWVCQQNLHETPEFKQERDRLYSALDKQLYTKYFADHHTVKVTDKDIRAFYDDNKDKMPELRISAQGVKVQAIKCDSKQAAEKILEKVKGQKHNIAKVAKEEGLKVLDYLMNSTSNQHPAIKKFALDVTSFPQVQVVKSGNSYFVVKAVEKQKAIYKEFSEVKAQLKPLVEQQLRGKHLEKVLSDLEKEFEVVENSDYFEKRKQTKNKKMKELQEAFAKQQKEHAKKADQDKKEAAQPASKKDTKSVDKK